MIVALELDNKNIIKGYVCIASEDYTNLMADDNRFTLADVDSLRDIVEYKTKYEDGQLIQLEDYCQEYYENQRKEEQRFLIQAQITELNNWFDKYDMQIKQYERNKRLNIEGVYHIDGEDYTIDELDEQAVNVANQIKELRKQLQELENPTQEIINENVDNSSEE